MAQNVRKFKCSPQAVFQVLSDGWLYPLWVVGASRMRTVERGWPQVGTRLHHSVGFWPAVLNDSTSSVLWDPPNRMVLKARAWPLGEAEVVIDVKGDGQHCWVRIREKAVKGPGSWVPSWLMDGLLKPRNAESLHRLAYIAEAIDPAAFQTTAWQEDSEINEESDGLDTSENRAMSADEVE